MPWRLEQAACLNAPFTSSMVVRRSTSAASSTIDTSGVGTRSEMPSILPFTSGSTNPVAFAAPVVVGMMLSRSEEHTSELQSHVNLVCRLLLENKTMKLAPQQFSDLGPSRCCSNSNLLLPSGDPPQNGLGCCFDCSGHHTYLHSCPPRRSSD